MLVVAVFGRDPDARGLAVQELRERFGPVVLESPVYPFYQTSHYAAEMGPGLGKQLLAFDTLVAADSLPVLKRAAIDIERQVAATGRFAEPRPVNLDPGHLTLGKFLLATTKDHSHRLYLGDGIFGEVTLHFRAGRFRPWPWTYADYRTPTVLDFLKQARDVYRDRVRGPRGEGKS